MSKSKLYLDVRPGDSVDIGDVTINVRKPYAQGSGNKVSLGIEAERTTKIELHMARDRKKNQENSSLEAQE